MLKRPKFNGFLIGITPHLAEHLETILSHNKQAGTYDKRQRNKILEEEEEEEEEERE